MCVERERELQERVWAQRKSRKFVIAKSVNFYVRERERLTKVCSGVGLIRCQIGSNRVQFFSHRPKRVKT